MVSTPDGTAADLGVRLIAGGDSRSSDLGFEVAETITDAEGRFVFPAVPPGQYILNAHRVPRPVMQTINVNSGMTVITSLRSDAVSAAPTFFAEMPLAVGGSDLDDLTLALRPGARVSGRVEFDGAAPRPPPQRLAQLAVQLTLVSGRLAGPVPVARADAEGRFTTAGYPPGRYWITAGSPGPQWTPSSIVVNGVDATKQPIELSDADIAGAIITFTDRVTELTGTVRSAGGDIGNITVIAFPADRSGDFLPRSVVTTLSDERGSYRLRIVVPGDYLVVAVPPTLAIDHSPEMYTALERVAIRVSFAAGDHKTQPLTMGQIR
jgi:hypothetical protein